jgi:hypothetical protein
MKKQSILAKLIVLVCSSVMLLGIMASASEIPMEQDSASLLSSSGDVFEPNDSIEQAFTVGNFSSNYAIKGTIHRPTDKDYYRFTLNRGPFLVSIYMDQSNKQNYSLKVYDVTDNQIVSHYTDTFTEATLLPHRPYVIEVVGKNGFYDGINPYHIYIDFLQQDISFHMVMSNKRTISWSPLIETEELSINGKAVDYIGTDIPGRYTFYDDGIHTPKKYNLEVKSSNNKKKYANIKLQLYGDMNGDGRVDSIDISKITTYLSGKTKLTEEEKVIADVDIDGYVTQADVDTITSYILGTIDHFIDGDAVTIYYQEAWDNPSPISEYQYGDVDLDGKITIDDALLVEDYALGRTDLSTIQMQLADVDDDSDITIDDSVSIVDYILGHVVTSKIGETAIFI